ncbi:solute carrier family 35 (UDP-galactose transporter), member B1 [Cryptococcus neoformans AD2-60a]|nr:solute carrier family 35 (UDP-galactose transporter), member B1 [Cryptococcus neoformans var. grubii AD2-60a]
MGVLRLAVCISGVYAAFLLWAIAQERLSKPFPSVHPHPHQQPHSPSDPPSGNKFPSPLFLNFAQAVASSLSALCYLSFKSWREGWKGRGLGQVLGLKEVFGKSQTALNGDAKANEEVSELNEKTKEVAKKAPKPPKKSLLALLVQVSVFQTIAGPIGFLALRHISYPTMVLGKSCKLIPVLLLNVLLYRRKFSPHKYIVVALVTVGISMFMLFAETSKKKKGGSDSMWGLVLLLVNLFIDGLTNSTQDQIFSSYPSYTGQQMMFTMALTTQIILLPLLILPLPTNPLSLFAHLPPPLGSSVPTSTLSFSPPAALESISFLLSHPSALPPLFAYALLGGLGQLFIFETIQHFGSLTLVMVTVTRKLFTMLLSVVVFEHRLTRGQWMGVGVVFAGIGVEAGMKRREVMKRAKKD